MIPMASSGSDNVRRNRPSGSGKPLSRSNSFLGTIKNLVTAPLNWFGAHDGSNKEDAKGKRRRLPDSSSTEDVRQDDGSRPKKLRVSSPEKQVDPGYLDPPTSIFKQSTPRHSPSSNPRYPSSVFPAFGRATQQPAHFRHSASPFPPVPEARPLSMGRTMSLDPPYHYGHGRDSSMAILTRDTSLDVPPIRNTMSIGRDVSLPPTRSFQMRPSLTPRPSSSSMVLSRRSRERDPSEPPPVASLMSNPVFLRPPPEAHHNRSMSAQPTVTLGSFLDSQRRVRANALYL
jgi:nucleoporin NUP1